MKLEFDFSTEVTIERIRAVFAELPELPSEFREIVLRDAPPFGFPSDVYIGIGLGFVVAIQVSMREGKKSTEKVATKLTLGIAGIAYRYQEAVKASAVEWPSAI